MNSQTVLVFLCIWATVSASGKIELFHSANYVGSMLVIEANAGCLKVPLFANDKITSVKTDVCIMAYQHYCDGRSIRITPDDPVGKDLANIDYAGSLHTEISSFQLCSEKEGGQKVFVDIFSETNYKNLQAQYENVCACVQLPSYIQHVGSVDNHGNCIRVYYTTDCTGTSTYIRAGRNQVSENMFAWQTPGHTQWKNMKSFHPCNIPDACSNLDAVVYRFDLTPSFSYGNMGTVELATKTQFRNNGTATITKEYGRTKGFTETFEVLRSTSLKAVSTVSTETNLEIGVTVGAEIGSEALQAKAKFETSIKASLKNAFSYSTESTNTESSKYTTSRTVEFTVSEKIEIPPCTSYEVSSFIKVLENVPIEYTVYFRVKGKFDNKPMTAQQIKEKLKDLTYVGNHDAWTVLAKTKGSMKATLGIEGVVDGFGTPISGCHTGHMEKVKSTESQVLKTTPVVFTRAITKTDATVGVATFETTPVSEKTPNWFLQCQDFILANVTIVAIVAVFVIAACGIGLSFLCKRNKKRYETPARSDNDPSKHTVYYFK